MLLGSAFIIVCGILLIVLLIYQPEINYLTNDLPKNDWLGKIVCYGLGFVAWALLSTFSAAALVGFWHGTIWTTKMILNTNLPDSEIPNWIVCATGIVSLLLVIYSGNLIFNENWNHSRQDWE